MISIFENISGPVHVLVSRSFDSNIAFLKCENHKVLIDTGTGIYHSSLERDLNQLGTEMSDITDIVLTHCHIDHIGGVLPILDSASPQIHLHRSEAERINAGDMSQTLGDTFGVDMPRLRIDGILDEGDILEFGDISLDVLSTPGHSSGSICLNIEDLGILITGDTLFAGGSFGRVDFPDGDAKKLVESLKRISEMNFATAIPGHMNVIRHNTKGSARQSYEMAKMMFRV
ncbi:MAG: MBL fold metallo-hydrolase [Candidatus Thorarchaeota archaeon]|nr:MAG: MBL fold metallo-hydrolase [Candidatus Thorarchaeota archaeon]